MRGSGQIVQVVKAILLQGTVERIVEQIGHFFTLQIVEEVVKVILEEMTEVLQEASFHSTGALFGSSLRYIWRCTAGLGI